MFNEIFILQICLYFTIYFYLIVINILVLWYLSGLYLFFVGWLALCDDLDIFIGFLWVIDLGVGLIFFLFILHFSQFLNHKNNYNVDEKLFSYITIFILFYMVFLSFWFLPNNNVFLNNYQIWVFQLSWYNYYELYFSYTITELNLLRELYYFNNSFEFFLINFMILYGLILSIILTFLIKRIFNILTLSQALNTNILNTIQTFFFIRNQNFVKQQNSSVGVRVWLKKKTLV